MIAARRALRRRGLLRGSPRAETPGLRRGAPCLLHARGATESEGRGENGGRFGGKDPGARSAYVHLPFCKRKCFYCDFPVVALGSEATGTEAEPPIFESYVNLLEREVGRYASDAARGSSGGKKLDTVFFGGGTPSLIPPRQLERVLRRLDDTFGIEWEGAEISMECDPGTFDRRRLRDYIDLGVNRISMGVQSFDDRLLELCGRSHTLREVYQAIDDLHAASPASWSIDLMFGLPHQSLRAWEKTLDEAVAAEPSHVSCYDLQVEEATPFARWYEVGMAPLPDEDTSAEFFKMASRRLGSEGYSHYEISNYAREGHECRHNMAYWRNSPFYAFGLGSTSNLHGRRVQRPRKYKDYEAWVEDHDRRYLELEQRGSGGEAEEQVVLDRLLDEVMLSLRLKDGLRVAGLDETFGGCGIADVEARIMDAVTVHIEKKLVLLSEDGKSIRLSDPEGQLVSNSIISDIFCKF
ncbi:oxygen-independent coproporphyrinogen III oxidase [Chloropicon primus]|uniref:Radical S-adenosyl methionine domain-containing protein 1, mitochondrial n=1 Tax=Chloropicon primus TaxID=1764295 RepID=A0A5B8MMR2_9CHLO|nr:oxygen-independent coproporphyrinogen III oxidase [Chloropicon primus]UPR00115.1 oxygen-independent coproporphyrinogen III oxidase [Chloropicon primus]|eukprot:QDZ20905.1 oxygen-independent coproporphyrinogen III oxidase [Chloropicon primus]